MKIPKATARFALVVARCGRPEPFTLWVSPQKNPSFQSAIEKNRVLTVKQQTVGAKKDFGIVGFYREPNVSYWVFPKSLAPFQDKRIIGIDYSLLKGPKLQDAADTFVPRIYRHPERPQPKKQSAQPDKRTQPRERAPAPAPRPEPIPAPPPAPARYRVKVRCIAELETVKEVEAPNKREARDRALAQLKNEALEFATGKKTYRVTKLEEI